MAGIRGDTVVSVLSLSHAPGVCYVTQYAVENVHVFIQTYNTVIRTKIFMYIHSQQKTVLSWGGGRRDGTEAWCITCIIGRFLTKW